jgi:predicted transcriptional regulator
MPIDRLRPLVRRLVALGFLVEQEEEGQRFYRITSHGQEYLAAYWRLRGYLDALTSIPLERVRHPPPSRID